MSFDPGLEMEMLNVATVEVDAYTCVAVVDVTVVAIVTVIAVGVVVDDVDGVVDVDVVVVAEGVVLLLVPVLTHQLRWTYHRCSRGSG